MTNSLCSPSKLLFSTSAGLELTPVPASFHQQEKKGSLVSKAPLLPCSSMPHGEPNQLDPNKCLFFPPPPFSFVVQSLQVGDPLPATTSFRKGLGCSPGDATPSHFLQQAPEPNIWNITGLGCCRRSQKPAQMEHLSLQLGGKVGGLELTPATKQPHGSHPTTEPPSQGILVVS